MYLPLFVGVLCLSLFCYALLYVYPSFAIILKRKRKLIALLLLSYRCSVTDEAATVCDASRFINHFKQRLADCITQQ